MGTVLFIILWVLSPIILLPMCISYSLKRKKIERFIDQLYREGRISSKEKFELKTEREINSRTLYNMTPVQRNEGSFFKDEARNTYGQKGLQDSTGNVGYVPQPQQISAEQNTAAAQNVSAVQENTPAQTAVQAEIQPQHHHDGVDLVKHTETVQEKPTEARPVQPEQKKAAEIHQPAAVHTVPVQRTPAPMTAEEYNNRQPLPEWARPQVVQRPLHAPRPKREKKQYSSAAVLTGIGITFVVLAGIIFSTAFWVQMSDWTRVGVLAAQAALFFGMFGFTHKKLKIEGTASAVYILGSVFTTIAYLTTGYFGLFGAWFGIEGGGMLLFLAMGGLLITFFAAGAMKVFAKPVYEYVSCATIAISGTLILGQFADYFENKYAVFSLLVSAAGLLVSVLLSLRKKDGKEISKPAYLIYKFVKAVYAVMAVPCLVADIGKGEVGFGWSLAGWGVWMIYTGETLWRAIRDKSRKWLAYHAVLILAGSVGLIMTLDNYPLFALLITIFSAVGSWSYIYLEKKDMLLFKADKVHFFMRAVFIMAAIPLLFRHPYESGAQFAVILIWLVDHAAMAVHYKRQALMIPQCAAVLSLALELISRLDHIVDLYNTETLASLILIVAGIIGTMVYRYLEHKGKVKLKANAVNVLMRILLSLPAFACMIFGADDKNLIISMSLLLITELSVYAVLFRRQNELFFRFVFICITVGMLIPHDFDKFGLDDDKLFALIMFGMSLVCTAVYEILLRHDKVLFRAKQFIFCSKAFISLFGLAIVLGDFFSDSTFGWFDWVMLGSVAAETLAYAVIKKSPYLLLVHNICLAFMLAECGILIDDAPLFALMVTGLLSALSMIYFRLHDTGKLRFSAKTSIILMRGIFGYFALAILIQDFGTWRWECFGIAVIIAIEMLYYAIAKRNQGILLAHITALTYSFLMIGIYAKDFTVFALICCLVAAVGKLVHHILKVKNKLRFDVEYLVFRVNLVYILLYVVMLFIEYPDYSPISAVIWAIVTAELIFYGIAEKDKAYIYAHSLTLPVLFHVISYMIGSHFGGGYTNTFIFTMLIAAALALYYIIPAIFSDLADVLYTAALFGLGVKLLYGAALPYGVIAMAVAAIFMAIQAFSKDHLQSKLMRLILPLPEIVTAMMLSDYIYREYGMHCRSLSMGICAAVLCAGAFALQFGDEKENNYRLMKTVTEIGSGVSLLMAYDHRRDLTAALIMTLVSVVLFAVMQTSKSNVHSALPVFTMFAGAGMAARSIWFDPMREGNAIVLFSIAMTAVLAVTSKLMFPDRLYKKDNDGLKLDVAHFGIVLCAISCIKESMMFSPRARMFIALLELTVFTANFIRSESTASCKNAAMTTAAGLAGLALIGRPFMQFENSTVTTKIILVIIVLFGLAVKKIWADDKKVSSEFSQTVFMAAFLLLIADGLMNQSLLNSLVVLSVSLVLLIYSFVRKTRRWFLISAVALLGLTLYITGDFLAAVAWWAYLLLAGIVLIVVAAVTEYLRQRAAKNPQEERFFVDWKW